MVNLNKYIEHTLLKPEATQADIKKILDEAIENNFFGVCVNPVNVAYAKKYLSGKNIKVVTVVGFPLGATYSEIKAKEAELTIRDGADEVDMVINVGKLKETDYDFVLEDIKTVKKSCAEIPLKVIIETDLLTADEIKKASELCVKAGANFVKTSTGFVKNGVGAKVENVKIMYDAVKDYGLQVKASGGIKTKADAEKLIEAGAVRLGTSSGVAIINS